MRIHVHLLAATLLVGFWAPRASALEVNYWPVFTEWTDVGEEVHSRENLGPLIFSETRPGERVRGVRPLYVAFDENEREAGGFHLLYPLFNLRERPYGLSWDVLKLIRYESFFREGDDPERSFQIFPFVFWQKHPDPERSYTGLFPVGGSVGSLFGYDRISWILFPLTARFEKGDETTVAVPWPFLRFVDGPETDGFHVWPLYGQVVREGRSSHRYWLWPLGYKVRRGLDTETPLETGGFLPFYAYSNSDRALSRTFVWPFFGYTHSRTPRYREQRYLWPFFVQRRGESYINRWAPFYTHSIRTGLDKRWILWPFFRQAEWEERGLLNERTQFLYFLYWSQTQSSVAHPDLAPAVKRHVWPLYSYWDNGAGRTQFQALSPFEVFFPFNDVVRTNYSPLFALYRTDVEEGVGSRRSFLFNFITTRRETHTDTFQLDVGPLFNLDKRPEAVSWELFKGFVSYSHTAGDRSFGIFWINRPDPVADGEPPQAQSSHE